MMITVEEAEKLVQTEMRDYGVEIIPFEHSLGRILAEDIKADRDLPPFNRVTMDGIAINYKAIEGGISSFHIKSTQAAGDTPFEVKETDHCVEIMTGAALPDSVDTVIRYEDLEIRGDLATLLADTKTIRKGQNLHCRGRDKRQYELIAAAGQIITPAIISLAASVGEAELRVKKLPRVVVISSGDELVEVGQTPSAYQIRRSNGYTVKAVLAQHAIGAALVHIPDDSEIAQNQIQLCLQNYDVLLLCGGISMGKFDYVPKALEASQVQKIFHKVMQRPGKPFWFGKHHHGALVFAFPGNPVSVFMCLHRYFLPWLQSTLGSKAQPPACAVLAADLTFTPKLTYFLQVKLHISKVGMLVAKPVEGNGSGDFANLAGTDAFMELPLEKDDFKKGGVHKVWAFNGLNH